MVSSDTSTRSAKRVLLLRDSATFLALSGISVALFLLTLLLFRSFENHREDLAHRWANRGRVALRNNRPDQAVTALRTALSYEETLPEQLLLAQALADAGHTEEAANYFLTLRESRPGDGFINLQLARLARRQNDPGQAIDDYRASIFGDWPGDGAQRRREVRFELSAFLAQEGQTSAARDELLIAAGNAPETAAGDNLFAERFGALNDTTDALLFYRKSLAIQPHQRETLGQAGRLAYGLGDYAQAEKFLTEALAEHSAGKPDTADALKAETQWSTLAAGARRIPELNLSRELPASERAEHLLVAAKIAQARLAACPAIPARTPVPSPENPPPPPILATLRSRWSAAAGQLKKRTLERDAALEDSINQLINDTETQTVVPCGRPEGDDALLLRLASSPQSTH